MHTRITARLTGRSASLRAGARGAGEGQFLADGGDLLSPALLQQAPGDCGGMAAKGGAAELVAGKGRKAAPLPLGQVPRLSIPTPAAAPTAAASGTTLVPAATPTAAPTAASAAPPRAPAGKHRRTRSAGVLQPSLSDDLDGLADATAKVETVLPSAAGSKAGVQQTAAPAAQLQPTPAALDTGAQRRSTRLAGAAPSTTPAALARLPAPVPLTVRRTAAPAPAVAAAAAQQPQQQQRQVDTEARTEPAVAAAASSDARRRVSFAPGPLDPERHPNSTQDGHPASEGAVVLPVRRAAYAPPAYGIDLSKGNVLTIEQLLGSENSMSVARLKRRVGLLPPARPERPHATAAASHQQHYQLPPGRR